MDYKTDFKSEYKRWTGKLPDPKRFKTPKEQRQVLEKLRTSKPFLALVSVRRIPQNYSEQRKAK